jgi:reactive chlorine resistance protein C
MEKVYPSAATRMESPGILSLDLESLGQVTMRYGLVLVLFWIGGMKFTAYEAEGIQGFVANSPFFSWLNIPFGPRTVSGLIGVSEIVIGLLIATGPRVPKAGLAGGIGATVVFLGTLTFMFTTPGVIEPSLGFPALSVVPGQFLIKDAVLLGVSVYCAGEALGRIRRND